MPIHIRFFNLNYVQHHFYDSTLIHTLIMFYIHIQGTLITDPLISFKVSRIVAWAKNDFTYNNSLSQSHSENGEVYMELSQLIFIAETLITSSLQFIWWRWLSMVFMYTNYMLEIQVLFHTAGKCNRWWHSEYRTSYVHIGDSIDWHFFFHRTYIK